MMNNYLKFPRLTKTVSLKSNLIFLLFSCFSLMVLNAQTTVSIASDNAGNYGTDWSGNAGTGFNSWVFQSIADGGFAGSFLEQNANFASPAIATSNKSFGTFANDGNFPRFVAFRELNENLQPGDSFTVEIQHGFITSGGSVGFTLRSGNNTSSADNYNTDSRFEVAFIGGNSNYSIFANTTTDTGIGFTTGGIRVKVTLVDLNTVDVEITTLNNSNTTTFANIALGGAADTEIQSLALFNRNARNANAYFNNVSVDRPSYTSIIDGLFSSPSTWDGGIAPDGKGEININNQVDLDVDLNLVGELNVSAANTFYINADAVLKNDGTINNSGIITFGSGSMGSAQYDTATGTISGSGEVTVERFIPAKRAYRFLTTSVNASGSINDDWQEGATTEDMNPNPNPGFGTHITGGLASDGFDQNVSDFSSMFTFDNSFIPSAGGNQNDAYAIMTPTNSRSLKAGEAYSIFIRGDRSIDVTNNAATPTNTTLRSTGNLFTGTREFSSANNASSPEYGLSTEANLFSLVGNPYQAIVDYLNLSLSNINSNFYWVWDVNLGDNGGFTTVNMTNPLSVTNNNGGPANQFIQPGQSFFVQTVANGASSLTFNEDDKDVNGDATAIFNEVTNPSIKVLLYKENYFNDGKRESDGTLIQFSSAGNNGLDLFDADKFSNSTNNLAINHSGKLISVENRALPTDSDIIQLSTTGFDVSNYTFVINASNISTNFDAFIFDHYTGTQTPLSEGQNVVNFVVDQNVPDSIDENRFTITFDNTTLGTENNTFGNDFRLYPNPSPNGQFSIKTPSLNGEVLLEISNLLGQNISRNIYEIQNNEVRVDAQNLSKGIYVVKLTQNDKSFNTKVIIE